MLRLQGRSYRRTGLANMCSSIAKLLLLSSSLNASSFRWPDAALGTPTAFALEQSSAPVSVQTV